MAELRHSLALEAVSKRYGDVVAVDGVSLAVQRGEFVTLLGPSGSGKTTILMMIAGFADPSAGEILLDGRPITPQPPEKRNFGMVFQGYALFPHLSVHDNIAFPLSVRGRAAAAIDKRVGEMLELVQLGALARRLPRQLSGGQQQRVALARALAFEPHLLLLDEPLSALDKKLRAELQDELKALHRRVGLTFISVTHDQDEALSLSDRVAILRDGRLVQYDRPATLYERPRSRFVADFLGKSNFLVGRALGAADGGFAYQCGDTRFVQATAAAAPPPGEAVLIALRPEKIALDPPPQAAPPNHLVGAIVDTTYLGADHRLTIEAEGLPPEQRRLVVSVPSWRCAVAPEPGARVRLGWDADASIRVAED
jgi:putative spermidine/putrescine transport system ATP-binding protein